MDMIVTLATVPAVIALVTLAKDLGIPSKWSPLVAIGLGVALTVFDGLAQATLITPQDTIQAVGTGLILGLSASGLYDGARAIGSKAETTVVVHEEMTTTTQVDPNE